MAKYVGVDWASKGWSGVVPRGDESWQTDHFPTIWSLWKRHSDASRTLLVLAQRSRDRPVPSKTTEEGITRREALLADEHPEAMYIYDEACIQYLTPVYASFLSARDDILDALVAARRSTEGFSRLPATTNPPRDERGLPMQMVYPRDINQTRLSTLGESRQS